MQKTALIVDDIAFARRVVKDILIAAKYTVVAEAANGNEAIQMYRQYKPDFVTMDVIMPVKGGIEAARKILEEDDKAKIIMVSALSHEQVLMEAINAGARDYILKPFSPDDLLKAVEKVLQQTEEEAALSSLKGSSHA